MFKGCIKIYAKSTKIIKNKTFKACAENFCLTGKIDSLLNLNMLFSSKIKILWSKAFRV